MHALLDKQFASSCVLCHCESMQMMHAKLSKSDSQQAGSAPPVMLELPCKCAAEIDLLHCDCHADALQQYCRGKGLDPDSVMPCVVDAGTDDVQLRSSEAYNGVKSARLLGSALHQVCQCCLAFKHPALKTNGLSLSCSEEIDTCLGLPSVTL